MLRIYDDMLPALRTMRKLVTAIERRDSDLAWQLRRAASSVALNIAEGSGSSGGNRTARYRTAPGSARETLACLRVAEACGYVDSVPRTPPGRSCFKRAPALPRTCRASPHAGRTRCSSSKCIPLGGSRGSKGGRGARRGAHDAVRHARDRRRRPSGHRHHFRLARVTA
jgi:four helix bundle protein